VLSRDPEAHCQSECDGGGLDDRPIRPFVAAPMSQYCTYARRTNTGHVRLSGIPKVLFVTRRQPGAGPGRGSGQHLIG
jgi:hypothetical protein